ncbi:MAG TPA: serine/threonine-protein kinase [Mycobacteriales bacterium]|nr:serine/threonine-protein kinase [Mycobacteriales bacterium]
MTAAAGAVLGGRYRLDGLVAAGGMGEVWRGYDQTLGRTVAVKLMHAQLSHEPGFLARFRGEARNTAALSHPGIATVYDYGEAGSRAYLVMQLIEGHSLADVLDGVGRLPAENTLDVVAQVASALEAAHAAGMIHRDVKPANLLVRPDGTVVVTDFGIARSLHATGTLTVTGEVMGTAAYLSPEQAMGKPASPATDVYSLGVVAYQCLAGRRPFSGDTPVATALAHLRDAPPPLPADVPPAVRAVVERAMAKDPADRFASAAALADAARAAATGRMPVPTPQPTTVMPTVGPAGPGATGRAAVRYGAVSAPPAPRSRPGTAALLRRPPTAVAGVAAGAVVAVLLGIGMTTMLLRSGSSDAEVAAASDTRGAASPSAAAPAAVAVRRTTAPPRPVHTLSAADYLGRPVSDVREELTALGLRVAVRQSDVPGRQDRVVALTPTHVREGETVTVSVTAPYTAPTDSPGNGRKWKGGGYHNEDEDD